MFSIQTLFINKSSYPISLIVLINMNMDAQIYWINELSWWWVRRTLPQKPLHLHPNQPAQSFPADYYHQSVLPDPWQLSSNPSKRWTLDHSRTTCLLWVESDEHFVHLVSGLVISRTGGHHVEEFGEFDLSTSVFVQLSDHLIDCLCFGLDAQGVYGNFQLSITPQLPRGSMAPPKSRSKRSKAFLISSTSSSVT